jgi:hypothetical protein
MDLYCPKCGEPCDFHEFDTPQERKRFTAGEGCGIWGYTCAPASDQGKDRAAAAGILSDLMGDDLDGIASMGEDIERYF